MLRFGGPILEIVCALAIFRRYCLGNGSKLELHEFKECFVSDLECFIVFDNA